MSDYVTFVLDGHVYATHITAVREVVRLAELVALPGMAAPLSGVLDLRGMSLPVVDLRKSPGGRGDVLVVAADGAEYGFVCDAVTSVTGADVLRPEDGRAASGALPDYVEIVLRSESGPVFLVDLARMVGDRALRALPVAEAAANG